MSLFIKIVGRILIMYDIRVTNSMIDYQNILLLTIITM